MYVCLYVCMYVCLYVCMYVCMYVCIYYMYINNCIHSVSCLWFAFAGFLSCFVRRGELMAGARIKKLSGSARWMSGFRRVQTLKLCRTGWDLPAFKVGCAFLLESLDCVPSAASAFGSQGRCLSLNLKSLNPIPVKLAPHGARCLPERGPRGGLLPDASSGRPRA